MSANIQRLFVLFVALALLTGCNATPTPVEIVPLTPTNTVPPTPKPTATSTPTETPVPPTSTPEPTATQTPTVTPTSLPAEYLEILGEERYEVQGGGFSFQAPEGYDVIVGRYDASLSSPDMDIYITLSGSPNVDGVTLAEKQEQIAADFTSTGEEDIQLLTEDSSIAGEPAILINIPLMEYMMTTTVVAAPLGDTNSFMGVLIYMDMAGLFGLPVDPSSEAVDYNLIFNAVLASLQFSPIPESALLPAFDAGTCLVSSDSTYGLSEENPIVLYHYPAYDMERMDEFLGLMVGPQGQSVQRGGDLVIEQESELEFSDVEMNNIVQVSVTYEGLTEPIVLYFMPLVPGEWDTITQPDIPSIFLCTGG